MERNQRQRVKCLVGKSRITSLALGDTKRGLMESSKFSCLCKMHNNKESSATLVQVLSGLYDGQNDVFNLNNDVSFKFCAEEVAEVLSIDNTGSDLEIPDATEVPPFVCDLRNKYCRAGISSAIPVTTSDLKDILREIEVVEEEKLIVKKLISFYIVDQFLVASTNKNGRPKFWNIIEDLATFESINWAKLTCNHIKEELVSLQSRLQDPKNAGKQLNFGGCSPVLEAIIYKRIPSLAPEKFTDELPLIQMHKPQRKNANEWKFLELTSDKIVGCPYCSVPAVATADDCSVPAVATADDCSVPVTSTVVPPTSTATFDDSGDDSASEVHSSELNLSRMLAGFSQLMANDVPSPSEVEHDSPYQLEVEHNSPSEVEMEDITSDHADDEADEEAGRSTGADSSSTGASTGAGTGAGAGTSTHDAPLRRSTREKKHPEKLVDVMSGKKPTKKRGSR